MISGRWHFPVDPDCPVVEQYMDALHADPFMQWSGCAREFIEAFEARHATECERCRAFGAANVEARYE